METDYYSTLGVSKDASPREIKEQFQKLSRTMHPDKQPEHLKRTATSVFTRIEKAKSVLLDEAQRQIYDEYGHEGLEVLNHSSSDIFRNGSFELVQDEDRTILSEKIKKLLKNKEEMEIRTELNPRTNFTLTMSCAEYLDYLDQDFRQPGNWHKKLILQSIRLEQLVKFNLGSRLSGDLGFSVYTKGGLGTANLTPKFYWAFGNGYQTVLGFQIGDRPSAAFTIEKAWEEIVLVGEVNLMSEGLIGLVDCRYPINDTTDTHVTVQAGISSSCTVGLTKEVYEKNRIKASAKVGTEDLEVNLKYVREITKKLVFEAGIRVINEGESYLTLNLETGTRYSLQKETSIGYFVSNEGDDLIFTTKVKRAGINFEFPVYLSNILSNKAVFFGVFGVGVVTIATSKLWEFYKAKGSSQRKKEIKQKNREDKKLYEKRFADEYKLLIKDFSLQIRMEEENNQGLVILEALYGSLESINRRNRDENTDLLEDVTLPLQALVENSKIYLSETPKSNLSGFFNPCEDSPYLSVKYTYGSIVNTIIIKDTEILTIP